MEEQGDPTIINQYKACPSFDLCNETPCRHLLSHDIDYLADLELASRDPRFHREVWFYFNHLQERAKIPPKNLSAFESLFERCQRITDKRDKLDAEIQANEIRRVLEWRMARGSNDIDITPEEIKELGQSGLRKYYEGYRARTNSGVSVEKVQIRDIFIEIPEPMSVFD